MLHSKYAVSISLLGLMCLTPESARARVYSYVGNAYTKCEGTYAVSGALGACAGSYHLSITFTVDLPAKALDNLHVANPVYPTEEFVNITADITDFRFTDGMGVTLTPANSPAGDYAFLMDTNASGLPTGWDMTATSATGLNAFSCTLVACGRDMSWSGGGSFPWSGGSLVPGQDGGVSYEDPGIWKFGGSVHAPFSAVSVAVPDPPAIPEPSTWAMMLLGFAGLGYAGYAGRGRVAERTTAAAAGTSPSLRLGRKRYLN